MFRGAMKMSSTTTTRKTTASSVSTSKIADRASLASYIRLFEPIVIKALKHYTVTTSLGEQVSWWGDEKIYHFWDAIPQGIASPTKAPSSSSPSGPFKSNSLFKPDSLVIT